MNENVKLPIETYREGNKITKVCVEDIYKIINRIVEPLNKVCDICDDADKEYNNYEGSLIIGTGVSQPCLGDAFDEEIGNNIAFMKAKLNANLKKRRLLTRIWKQLMETLAATENEIDVIEIYIQMDIEGIRRHNPNYMPNYEPFFEYEDEINEKED